MRIMSYNIRSGHRMDSVFDPKAQADVINSLAPDICALNEVLVGAYTIGGVDLAKRLGELTGMYYSFARAIDHRGGQYGIGMLCRYPILEEQIVPVPDVPEGERDRNFESRTTLTCMIDTPEGRVRAITSHFGLSKAEQANAVRTVLSLLGRSDLPTAFMGDLNVTPETEPVCLLRGVLHDSAEELPLTFPSEKPRIRIDYIFTNERLAPAEMHTVETLASDHLPVYIDTRILPEGGCLQ